MSVHPILAVLGVTAMLAPTLLHAEPLVPRDKPITVTVRMTTHFPIGPNEDDAALQRQAREAFYKTAAGECAVITETLKGDCAVVQVTISTRRTDNRMASDQPPVSNVAADGMMSFAVTPAETSSQ